MEIMAGQDSVDDREKNMYIYIYLYFISIKFIDLFSKIIINILNASLVDWTEN